MTCVRVSGSMANRETQPALQVDWNFAEAAEKKVIRVFVRWAKAVFGTLAKAGF